MLHIIKENNLVLGAHFVGSQLNESMLEAKNMGFNALQVFLGNPYKYVVREPSAEEIYRSQMIDGIDFKVVHSCLLINLASPEDRIRKLSVKNIAELLAVVRKINFNGAVCHIGSHKNMGIDFGNKKVIRSLNEIADKVGDPIPNLFLESGPGNDKTIAGSLYNISKIIEEANVGYVSICLDTAHSAAAGYDLSKKGVIKMIHDKLGHHIRLVHLNDNPKNIGSHIDRHCPIGVGSIGLESLLYFIETFRDVPMILERREGYVDDIYILENKTIPEHLVKTILPTQETFL